jgi:plastocyanin
MAPVATHGDAHGGTSPRPNARRTRMKIGRIAVLSGLVVALAGASTAAARPSVARATTVKVTAKDYSFTLSTKTVKHGRLTFVIGNSGKTAHNFEIAGHVAATIAPGKTTRLSVTLKPGRYPYMCTVDSHAKLGMKGVLRVT